MKTWLFAKDKHDIFQANEPWPLYDRGGKKKKRTRRASPLKQEFQYLFRTEVGH